MRGQRRAFFFGITLSEIAFILFFALLLFAFYRFGEDAIQLEGMTNDLVECREQLILIETLQEEIRNALSNPNITPEEVIRRMTEVDQLTAEVIELSNLVERLERQVGDYQDIKDSIDKVSKEIGIAADIEDLTARIKQALIMLEVLELWIQTVAPPGTFDSPEEAQQFALDAAEEKLMASQEISELFDPNETIEDVRQKLSNTQGQLQYCMSRLNECRGGRDLPPCWVNEVNPQKVDYLLSIDLYDDGLEIQSAAIPSREDDFLQVPGASSLIRDRIDLNEFRKEAQIVLDHSNELMCRHYVSITDRSEFSYKSTLTIEDYFYKFVNQ